MRHEVAHLKAVPRLGFLWYITHENTHTCITQGCKCCLVGCVIPNVNGYCLYRLTLSKKNWRCVLRYLADLRWVGVPQLVHEVLHCSTLVPFHCRPQLEHALSSGDSLQGLVMGYMHHIRTTSLLVCLNPSTLGGFKGYTAMGACNVTNTTNTSWEIPLALTSFCELFNTAFSTIAFTRGIWIRTWSLIENFEGSRYHFFVIRALTVMH